MNSRASFRVFRGRWEPTVLAAIVLTAGCVRTTPANVTPSRRSLFAFAVDSNFVETIAPGVNHRFIYSSTGPWAIHALIVDLRGCNAAIAVKDTDGAAGRIRATKMFADLGATETVLAGVNADFFSLATGAPIGALVTHGKLITGPYSQPVLAFDSTGRAHAMVLRAKGTVTIHGRRFEIHDWNRADTAGLAYFDAAWGHVMDTSTSAIKVVVQGLNPSRVVAIDTTRAGVTIPRDGGVLVWGRAGSSTLRAPLASLRVGDTIRVAMSLSPFAPVEVVGGRPMLTRDSVIVAEVQTEGQASFRLRNPRTAAGISHDGRRLILVVVDGRQKGYSDGMTLPELATLMLALGARDAINLDGGGSSTMLIADRPAPAPMRIVNSVSDSLPNGLHVERAIGDGLAMVKRCSQ